MELSYIEFDERVDAQLALEKRARKGLRRRFDTQFQRSRLYHELHLEGVAVAQDDVERALKGKEGTDYCDGVLLDRVRCFDAAWRRMEEAPDAPLTMEVLKEYHTLLNGAEDEKCLRNSAGATEQYKHEVVDPEGIAASVEEALALVEKNSHTRHPIEAAIDLHFALIRAWPFDTWSAAIARLAANRVLLRNEIFPVIIAADLRQQYYQAMHYDHTRLRDLYIEALQSQLDLRERFFGAPRAAARA